MRQRFFAAAVLILSVLLSPLAAVAQQPADASAAEKEALARELLAVSGAGDLGVQMMEQMVGALRPAAPDMPEEFWDRVFSEVDADELVELVVPIYIEHLTVEEMQAAIDFYETPEGQSLIEKMPVISQESFAVGQQWGMELAQRVMEEIEAAQEDGGDGER
jgi:hypothetical protein